MAEGTILDPSCTQVLLLLVKRVVLSGASLGP